MKQRSLADYTSMRDLYTNHTHGWKRIKTYDSKDVYIKWEKCVICGMTMRTQFYVSELDDNRTENDSP